MRKAKTCENCCNLVNGMCLYYSMKPRGVVKLEPDGFKCPLEDFDKKKRERAKLKLKDDEYKARLVDMYIVKKMSMIAISAELNVTLGSVKYHMEKFEITRRTHSEIAKAQWERNGWGK